jgi:hypothetical protein
VLKAHFDGSHQPWDGGLLTLAGLAASEVLWPDFDASWLDMLGRHGLKWWHSADAMSLRSDEFLRVGAARWDRLRAEAAFGALSELITDFWKAPLIRDVRRQKGPQIVTCAVDLEGYRAARQRKPWLRSAEAICVHVCVGSLVIQREDDVPIALYFDRGERFMKEVEQVWRKDQKRPELIWPRQVGTIEPLDWQRSYALQAADLLAWSTNRQCRVAGEGAWGASFFQGLNRIHAFHGQAEIKAEYTREGERERLLRQQRTGRQTVFPDELGMTPT